MKKLWDKGFAIDKEVEIYTVGNDLKCDKKLLFYDCLGSIAHAAMLKKIGILSTKEHSQLFSGLLEIIALEKKEQFPLSIGEEDVHTAVENYLTDHYGEVGKKLHTARSRNDQVCVDIRLYLKEHLIHLGKVLLFLCDTLYYFAKKYERVPIPGRTHMQRAMPSSLGLWAGAFLESLLDNFLVLEQAYVWNDQCPLGSAASYGSAIAIDRQYTSDLLGFAKVQNNVLYANNSRGKIESSSLHAFAQIMTDLSRMATDLIFFTTPEFGYLSLAKECALGSSLMPQKKNPCALELIRAKAAVVIGSLSTSLAIIRPLSSGYSRDLQETKNLLMDGVNTTISSVSVLSIILQDIEVHEENCIASFTNELFATDSALELVQNGVPFRDAYRQVAEKIEEVGRQNPLENILSKTHLGSTGNLGLSLAKEQIKKWEKWILEEENKWEDNIGYLLKKKEEMA